MEYHRYVTFTPNCVNSSQRLKVWVLGFLITAPQQGGALGVQNYDLANQPDPDPPIRKGWSGRVFMRQKICTIINFLAGCKKKRRDDYYEICLRPDSAGVSVWF